MDKLINIVSSLRATFMKKVKPKDKYFFATRRLEPISTKFGFDRGTPIDRYYIEKFLAKNRKFIEGRCLEVVDDSYSKKFGGKRVKKRDILDNNLKNFKANIHGDLRNLTMVGDNVYDCLILTHTLGMVDDFDAAIRECHRILKPSGVLLVTVSSFSPVWDLENSIWRFTVAACKYAFGKYFKPKNLTVKSYGNVLTGQCFWVGLSQEELTKRELDYNDPHFPNIITIKAIKERSFSVQ
jgi:SAM-dependent methyltransferase